MNSRYRVTLLATIAVIFVMTGLVALTTVLVGLGSESTPALVMLAGIATPTILALLALLRLERAEQQLPERVAHEQVPLIEQTVERVLAEQRVTPSPPGQRSR